MVKKIVIIAVFIMFLTTSQLNAECYRCNGRLIFAEDHIYKVLKLCGEPDYKELISMCVWKKKIEHWIYGPKAGWYYCLIFSDGKLHKIEKFRK